MHFLHAILVKVEVNGIHMISELEKKARTIAMTETKKFGEGIVFARRTEDDAGEWIKEYPGKGVILGMHSREQFVKELDKWKEQPFRLAMEEFKSLLFCDEDWHTRAEIEEMGYEIIESESSIVNGEEMYWSGKRREYPLINELYLEKAWSNEVRGHDEDDMEYASMLCSVLKRLTGDYTLQSGFYSVPDSSSKLSKYTYRDAVEHPEKYALVFSNYHS